MLSTESSRREPTYTTPELVAETMGLPDPGDPLGFYRFSDTTVPSYDYVCRMIVSAEGEIDRRLNRSWRENFVKDEVHDISTYQWDAVSWRSAYHARGGNFVQLRKDVRPWDPQKGDRLYMRTYNNQWRDLSLGNAESATDDADASGRPKGGNAFWVDSTTGRLFLRNNYFQSPYNSVRISYRYGSEDPVPEEISRLCSLMVADRVITMGIFSIKVGSGGDIAGIKQDLHRTWQEEMGAIFGAWQRPGAVISLLG